MFRLFQTKLALGTLSLVLVVTTAADAQYSNTQNRNDFYNGVRDGQAGGQYSQDPRHSYDQNGYDQNGYDRNGFNRSGYNPSGYNRNGQRQQQGSRGYPSNPNGDDRDGYNQNGYNQSGYDRNGYNQSGYDRNGRDRDGRTQAQNPDNRYGDPAYRSQTNQGGIGPGKGAIIGGAGGALLGALFGGGLKGALIGGAAGAGIGAVVGKHHQTTVRRRNGYSQ